MFFELYEVCTIIEVGNVYRLYVKSIEKFSTELLDFIYSDELKKSIILIETSILFD